MISRITPSFRKAFAALSAANQQAARRAYRLFDEDAGHPSLHFKKLVGQDGLWSVRVTVSVRAVGVRDGDTITWVWIGTHAQFYKLFG